MKIVIASDIHGSATYTARLLQAFNACKGDTLVLLGDIYNHGPRNPLPQGYAPPEVAAMLNAVKDRLVVIRGNCDSEVDGMISQFAFVEEAVLLVRNKRVFCTHGHRHNIDAMPPLAAGDVLVYGHFHRVMCTDKEGVLVLNPGSISLPHDDKRAYIVLDEEGVCIRTLEGETLHTVRWAN